MARKIGGGVSQPVVQVSMGYTYKFAFNFAGKIGDCIQIGGASGVEILVKEIAISKPSVAQAPLILAKRSALGTGGVAVPITGVPLNRASPAAQTIVNTYTTAQTAGTAIGNLLDVNLGTGDTLIYNEDAYGAEPISLGATTDAVAVVLSADATVTGWITVVELSDPGDQP